MIWSWCDDVRPKVDLGSWQIDVLVMFYKFTQSPLTEEFSGFSFINKPKRSALQIPARADWVDPCYIRYKRTREIRGSRSTEVIFEFCFWNAFFCNAPPTPHNSQAPSKTLWRIARHPSYILRWHCCVVSRSVESAHANNGALPLPPLLLRRYSCCCCVPKLSMCPSITGFQYRFVGAFYVRDMRKKRPRKTSRFFGFVFSGSRKSPAFYYGSTSYSSKAQYTAEKPVNHWKPTNPPCVYNSTTAVQQKKKQKQKSRDRGNWIGIQQKKNRK